MTPQAERPVQSDRDRFAGRLAEPAGRLIERDKPIEFYFEGRPYIGYRGDTIASALAAQGQFVLSRSFKYHRARGVVTMAGQDANTIVQVPGNPNALADRYPISDQLQVQPVNIYGSLQRDRGRFLGLFGRFLPVGFYYKAFFRPKGAWEYWSRLFRRMTGLGVLDQSFRPERHDKRYRFFDVVVVGGGAAGMAAAIEASRGGVSVLLVDENPVLGGALTYDRRELLSGTSCERLQVLQAELNGCSNVEVMTDAVCNGWFADNWLPVICGKTLHKVRARQLVLATGMLEQPAIFHNNDLPGIMMSSAAQRLIHLFGVRPGRKAVVLTSNDCGYATARDLLGAGVTVAAVIDTRQSPPTSELTRTVTDEGVAVHAGSMIYAAKANANKTHVAAVEVRAVDASGNVAQTGERFTADLVCVAVGFMPTYQLACQAGATLNYHDETSAFSISSLPEGVHIAGAVNGIYDYEHAMFDGRRAALEVLGELNADSLAEQIGGQQMQDLTGKLTADEPSPNAAWPIVKHPDGKEFVDADEDLQINDLVNATLDGYADIQLVKRYSTCGMGPSQGRQSALAAARIVAHATNKTVAQTGVTTARPPFAAEQLSHSAGRSFYPRRQTSMHGCHLSAGATMMQAGLWDRPAFYAPQNQRDDAIRREVNAVRECVGLIDVSTLGGLEIRGPDAAEFINRMYTWGFVKQPVGRARYALMTDQSGVVIDDGVACRFADDHFYVTATTSGVDRVYRNMLKWNAQWRLDVDVANVTAAWAAVNLAGPRARDVLARVCNDVALSAEQFGYMEVRCGHVAGIKARLLRVGFVGELGYEIHVPQSCGHTLWQALMQAGEDLRIVPFGVEAQRVMRLEKGHIIIGQDTDAMSNPLEVQMRWAVSTRKPFFVGGRSLEELEQRGIKRKLVGFALEPGASTIPLENQLVLDGDSMIGRVTSCALSPTLGTAIGLAYVPYTYDETVLCIKCNGGQRVRANVVPATFYDPESERQKL